MGSGKTTAGRALAARLGWDFADLDGKIETMTGLPVPQIFESEGEAAFRKMETEALKTVLQEAPGTAPERQSGLVLALGGGTLLRPESAELVRRHCVCVWLKPSADELCRRLSGQAGGRPLLAGDELRASICTLLSERESGYRKYAGITVEVDGLSPEETAQMIENEIKKL